MNSINIMCIYRCYNSKKKWPRLWTCFYIHQNLPGIESSSINVEKKNSKGNW